MKTRVSFVANSSSSSFIIGCKKKPKSVPDAGKIWFGDRVDQVSSYIVQFLFTNLKPFKLDLDKLMERVKTQPYKKLSMYNQNYKENPKPIDVITQELMYEFEYEETRSGYSHKCKYEVEIDYVIDKFLAEHREVDRYRLKDKTLWREILDLEYNFKDTWMDKPEVKEKIVAYFQKFVDRFKDCPVLMQAEIGDDCGDGEYEHGNHWDKFPVYERFSHH